MDMSYHMQSTGWLPQAEFVYLLETGAGWYSQIGKGEISLILPYDAAPGENINLKESSPGAEVVGSMVTWTFNNLEPDSQDNWHAQLIDPETWKSILDLREKLEKNPNEADFLRSLAMKYGDIVYGKGLWNINPGTEPLAVRYREILQVLIDIIPEDAKIKNEYAGILFAMYQNPTRFPGNLPSLNEVYSALNQAYLNDPKNWEVSQMYKDLTNQGIQLPTLGVQPTTTVKIKPIQTPTVTTSIFEPFLALFKDEDQLIFYGIVGIALLILGFIAGTIIQKKKRG